MRTSLSRRGLVRFVAILATLTFVLLLTSMPMVATAADAVSAEDKIANAMSAGPAVIAEEAAILDYPQGWPGNWPDEPAEEFVELRPGSNGWTCIVDAPDTPGNDPMCLNETQRGMVLGRYALIDPPSTGIGVGYMLQGGGPVGTPPHIMIFAPGAREDLTALSTDVDPITWANGWNMFSETPYAHLMIATPPQPEAVSVDEDKIANAMSAGPAVIAEEAAILDYPQGWPGNWPDEPAEEFVELRPGSNGWTCIVDAPDTPGNDPMCLNETQRGMVLGRYALIDPPSTGYGVGYMLQGGGPVGSPPHIMIFAPGAREDLTALSTDVDPITWASGWNMFSETPYAHLMIAVPSQPEEVSDDEQKIQNAMSAGPAEIAEEAAILDYPQGWPGNWPDEPAPEYVELRPGSNGWSCIVDNPTTPGNDPMCLNETQLAMVEARNALIDPPSTGYGVGYMLQGGGPVGTPPHIMIFTPGSREDLIALSTDMNPSTWANGWNMYSDTPYAHLMIVAPPQPEAVSVEEDKIQNAMSAGPAEIAEEAAILDYPQGWPGNWPDEPAPEYVELRPGSNGWSCIVDNPTTPGNDPMCLNETQLAMVQTRNALIDPPSTGYGVGYMLQGGGPVGTPPHIMIFAPGAREDLIALSTDMNPSTWANGWNMYADTPYAHLMIAVPPQPEVVSIEEDKIANAVSAGPRSVTDNAAVLDWPSETNPEFSELRTGTNGWTCIPDDPTTPINDPMCLDEQWMVWLSAYAGGTDLEITELGWSYMLQGGAAVSDADPFATLAEGEELLIDPPHLMVLVPGELDSSRYPTDRDSGGPYLMWADTAYQHFMLPLDLDASLQTDDKALTFMQMTEEAMAQVEGISATEALDRLTQDPEILLVDVRDQSDVLATGLATGGVNITLGMLPVRADLELPEEWRYAGLEDRSRPIITTCVAGPNGARAAKLLDDMGFTDVVYMEGGMAAWLEADLPMQGSEEGAVTAEIEAAFAEYAGSLGAGDAERWIQLWTEDGVQLPPGAAPNVGRDVILASLKGAMEVFAFDDMQIDIEEVLVAGDLAVARGMYTVTYIPRDGSDPIPVDGKYTSTFQRQPDGSWKLYRDIFNSNVPPQ